MSDIVGREEEEEWGGRKIIDQILSLDVVNTLDRANDIHVCNKGLHT